MGKKGKGRELSPPHPHTRLVVMPYLDDLLLASRLGSPPRGQLYDAHEVVIARGEEPVTRDGREDGAGGGPPVRPRGEGVRRLGHLARVPHVHGVVVGRGGENVVVDGVDVDVGDLAVVQLHQLAKFSRTRARIRNAQLTVVKCEVEGGAGGDEGGVAEVVVLGGGGRRGAVWLG